MSFLFENILLLNKKMKDKDSKPAMYVDKSLRHVMLLSLCALSFYLGGIFFYENNRLILEDKTSLAQVG
jgi:hypothetical protein